MKKILGGYLFRAVKTAEIWFFIALTIFAIIISNVEIIGGISSSDNDILTTDYTTSLSIEEEYAFVGAYPQGGNADVENRIRILVGKMDGAALFAAAASTIFNVIFLKSLFSSGALRNLIASGHKKAGVYFTSLIFCILVYVLFNLIALGTLCSVIWIRQWKFPLFMPYLRGKCFMLFFIGLAINSVALSLLFCSKKATTALVTLAVLLVLAAGGTSFGLMSTLMIPERELSAVKLKEYTDSRPDSTFKIKLDFDIKNFEDKQSILENGEPIDPELYLGGYNRHYISGTPRKVLATMIYINPGSYYLMDLVEVMTKYRMWKDGLYLVNNICCTSWSIAFGALGFIVFSKKELT